MAVPGDPAIWRRAEPIVDELHELDAAARTARLASIALADPNLHACVEAWLGAADTDGALSRPADARSCG